MVYLKKHCLKKDYFIDWHVCGNISQPPWNFSTLKLKSFLTPLKFLNPTNPPPEKSSIPPEKFQSLLKNLNSSRKNLNPSWKILTPPEKILTPLKFLNHTKISQPPPPQKKNFNPLPPENFSPPPKKKNFSTPHENFSTPPPKKINFSTFPPRKFLTPPENFSNPPENISTPKNILTIYTPLPFLSFFFFYFLPLFLHFQLKIWTFRGGGRFEPPEPPIRPCIPHLVTQ